MKTERPVYLDNQATTQLDPRVRDAVVEALDVFGNPHGRQHSYGRAAAHVIDDARGRVAQLLNTYPRRVIFTSGSTESCNLALKGVASRATSHRKRIVTVETEHAAVLETAYELERIGFEVVILRVESDGLVNLKELSDVVNDQTLIVSVMAVNNEIGVIQPLQEISEICRKFGVVFHSDATQAPARIEIDVEKWGVDLLSISSHKFYGPKGIGALYVADDSLLSPLMTGGGQERGLRSGTVATPLVCGFGEASVIACEEVHSDASRMKKLAASLLDGLRDLFPCVREFGSHEQRAPGTLSFGIPGISGDKLVALVERDVAISTGSACSSGQASASHVLIALGCSTSDALTGVRVGFGRFNTEQDVEVALASFLHVGQSYF